MLKQKRTNKIRMCNSTTLRLAKGKAGLKLKENQCIYQTLSRK